MRISDWSSDVCSSDLQAARSRKATVRLPSCRTIEYRCYCRSSGWNCHLFPCQSPVAARKGRSCRVGSSQPVYRLGNDAGVGNDATRAAGLDRRAGRSEEHTSELQSLMRISYAVFCLKKNTNIITNLYNSIS